MDGYNDDEVNWNSRPASATESASSHRPSANSGTAWLIIEQDAGEQGAMWARPPPESPGGPL